tara:strand:+ start:5245 stop:5478 length:234 start_codon:yes stop_codon:yes gene_type:complete
MLLAAAIVVVQHTAIKEKAMLVLSRKEGEKIDIDGDITVTILELRSNFVRLGVDAPDNVKILRYELTREEAELDEVV